MNNYPICPQCQQASDHLDQRAEIKTVMDTPVTYRCTYICVTCGERLVADWQEEQLPSQETELLQTQKAEARHITSQRSLADTTNAVPTCQRCGDPMTINLNYKPESLTVQRVKIRYKCNAGDFEYGTATWDRSRLPHLEMTWCRNNGLPVK